MNENEGRWVTIHGKRVFLKTKNAQLKKQVAEKVFKGKEEEFESEEGSVIKVKNLKDRMVGDSNWGEQYGEYVGGTYESGLNIGDTFGLRMLGIHNTNVYGRVSKINKDSIEVIHPHGTIYKVPINNVCNNNNELRFMHDNNEHSWFGFIDIRKKGK